MELWFSLLCEKRVNKTENLSPKWPTNSSHQTFRLLIAKSNGFSDQTPSELLTKANQISIISGDNLWLFLWRVNDDNRRTDSQRRTRSVWIRCRVHWTLIPWLSVGSEMIAISLSIVLSGERLVFMWCLRRSGATFSPFWLPIHN